MFATNTGQSSAFFCCNAMLKIYDLFTRYISKRTDNYKTQISQNDIIKESLQDQSRTGVRSHFENYCGAQSKSQLAACALPMVPKRFEFPQPLNGPDDFSPRYVSNEER